MERGDAADQGWRTTAKGNDMHKFWGQSNVKRSYPVTKLNVVFLTV